MSHARRQQGRRATPGSGSAEVPVEALARAGRHARNAAAELLAALRALLDAAALLAEERPAGSSRWLAPAAEILDAAEASLRGAAAGPPEALHSLASTLDAEIRRWEERSRVDAEARAVLRALMGVRELLWELGVRAPGAGKPGPGTRRRDPLRARPAGRARDPFAAGAPDLFGAGR